jgi:hypothetical protein
MIRRRFLTPILIAAALAGLFATAALAQGGPGKFGRGPHGPGGANPDATPEERAEIMMVRLSHRLDLTDAQKEQLLPILLDQAEQVKAIHEEAAAERQLRRQQMEQIRDTTHAGIESLLDPDQLEKFQEMVREREEQRMRRQIMREERQKRRHQRLGR